jgi:WNK lysine deficient protein kinase
LQLDHPNIISFYTSWYNREDKKIVFITELMNAGSLADFVKPITLRWRIVKKWALKILHGLTHLHQQRPPIIHRNIKCDNIFVTSRGELKIGDLGLSTFKEKPESCVGTLSFMAPELFEEDYDEKVDIYAFGMCILQALTKEVGPAIRAASPESCGNITLCPCRFRRPSPSARACVRCIAA